MLEPVLYMNKKASEREMEKNRGLNVYYKIYFYVKWRYLLSLRRVLSLIHYTEHHRALQQETYSIFIKQKKS